VGHPFHHAPRRHAGKLAAAERRQSSPARHRAGAHGCDPLQRPGRPDAIAANTAALSAFITAQHLQAIGPVSLAQYDPPWKLWFLRRNELMIPVAPAAQG
jgi:hypothetical protein